MARQALHDEDFLAATRRITRRYVCVEQKLRPSLQRIGATSEACNRLRPLLRRNAGTLRVFPHQIKRPGGGGLASKVRPWMRRVFDCDPSDRAPARSTRDQAPRKLRGKAIVCARFEGVHRIGRQPAQQIEKRNGPITHRSAVRHIACYLDCLGSRVAKELCRGKLSFLAAEFDQKGGWVGPTPRSWVDQQQNERDPKRH